MFNFQEFSKSIKNDFKDSKFDNFEEASFESGKNLEKIEEDEDKNKNGIKRQNFIKGKIIKNDFA